MAVSVPSREENSRLSSRASRKRPSIHRGHLQFFPFDVAQNPQVWVHDEDPPRASRRPSHLARRLLPLDRPKSISTRH